MSRNQFEQMLEEMEQSHYHRWCLAQGNSVFYPMLPFSADWRQDMHSSKYEIYTKNYNFPSYWLFPNLSTSHSQYPFSPPRNDAGRSANQFSPRRFFRKFDDNFQFERSPNEMLSNPSERRHLSNWNRGASNHRYRDNNSFRSFGSYDNFSQRRESVKNYASERIESSRYPHNKIETDKYDFWTKRKTKFSPRSELKETSLNVMYSTTERQERETNEENKMPRQGECSNSEISRNSSQATSSNLILRYDSWFCFEEQQQIVDMLRDVHIRHERQLKRDVMTARGVQLNSDESAIETLNASQVSQSSDDEDGVTVLVSPKTSPPIPSPEIEDVSDLPDDYRELSASDYFQEFQNIFTVSPEKQIINSLTKELLRQYSSDKDANDSSPSKMSKCNILGRFESEDRSKEDAENENKLREDTSPNLKNVEKLELIEGDMSEKSTSSVDMPVLTLSPKSQISRTCIFPDKTDTTHFQEIKILDDSDNPTSISLIETNDTHIKETKQLDSGDHSPINYSVETNDSHIDETKPLDTGDNSKLITLEVTNDIPVKGIKLLGNQNHSTIISPEKADDNRMKEIKHLDTGSHPNDISNLETNHTHIAEKKQMNNDISTEETNNNHIKDQKQLNTAYNSALFSPEKTNVIEKKPLDDEDSSTDISPKETNGTHIKETNDTHIKETNDTHIKDTNDTHIKETNQSNNKGDSQLIYPAKTNGIHLNNIKQLKSESDSILISPIKEVKLLDCRENVVERKQNGSRSSTCLLRNVKSPSSDISTTSNPKRVQISSRPIERTIKNKAVCSRGISNSDKIAFVNSNAESKAGYSFEIQPQNFQCKNESVDVSGAYKQENSYFNNSKSPTQSYSHTKPTSSKTIDGMHLYCDYGNKNNAFQNFQNEKTMSGSKRNETSKFALNTHPSENQNRHLNSFSLNVTTRPLTPYKIDNSFKLLSHYIRDCYIPSVSEQQYSHISEQSRQNLCTRNVNNCANSNVYLRAIPRVDERLFTPQPYFIKSDTCFDYGYKKEMNSNPTQSLSESYLPPRAPNIYYKKISVEDLFHSAHSVEKNINANDDFKGEATTEQNTSKNVCYETYSSPTEHLKQILGIPSPPKLYSRLPGQSEVDDTIVQDIDENQKRYKSLQKNSTQISKQEISDDDNLNESFYCSHCNKFTNKQEINAKYTNLDRQKCKKERLKASTTESNESSEARKALKVNSKNKKYDQNVQTPCFKQIRDEESITASSKISSKTKSRMRSRKILSGTEKSVAHSKKASSDSLDVSESHLNGKNVSPDNKGSDVEACTQNQNNELGLLKKHQIQNKIRNSDTILSISRKDSVGAFRKMQTNSLRVSPDLHLINKSTSPDENDSLKISCKQTCKNELQSVLKYISSDEIRKSETVLSDSRKNSKGKLIELQCDSLKVPPDSNSPQENIPIHPRTPDKEFNLVETVQKCAQTRKNDSHSALEKPLISDEIRKLNKISSDLPFNSQKMSTDSSEIQTNSNSAKNNISPNVKSPSLKTFPYSLNFHKNSGEISKQALSDTFKTEQPDSNLGSKKMSPDEKKRLLDIVKKYTQTSQTELPNTTKKRTVSDDTDKCVPSSSETQKDTEEEKESQLHKGENKEKCHNYLDKSKDRNSSSKKGDAASSNVASNHQSHDTSFDPLCGIKRDKKFDAKSCEMGKNVKNYRLDQNRERKKMYGRIREKQFNYYKYDAFNRLPNYWYPPKNNKRYYRSSREIKLSSVFKKAPTSVEEEKILNKTVTEKEVKKSSKSSMGDEISSKPIPKSNNMAIEKDLDEPRMPIRSYKSSKSSIQDRSLGKSKEVVMENDFKRSCKSAINKSLMKSAPTVDEIVTESDSDFSDKSGKSHVRDNSSSKPIPKSNNMAIEKDLDEPRMPIRSCKSSKSSIQDRSLRKSKEEVMENDFKRSCKSAINKILMKSAPTVHEIITESDSDFSDKSGKSHVRDNSSSKSEPTLYEIASENDLNRSIETVKRMVRDKTLKRSATKHNEIISASDSQKNCLR